MIYIVTFIISLIITGLSLVLLALIANLLKIDLGSTWDAIILIILFIFIFSSSVDGWYIFFIQKGKEN